MENKLSQEKINIIFKYIERLEKVCDPFDFTFNDNIYDLIYEIIEVFEEDIPKIRDAIIMDNGAEIRNINVLKGLLKMYLANNGVVREQGYKTTFQINKIVNYRMFERKIKFAEEMINGSDLLEKKSALDFLIDSLQYIISIQEGNREKQYSALALSVNADNNSKVYTVIKQEIQDLMKMSNDYFDIRHNDYLNSKKEKRESLSDSQFIEYLYNRAYALLYILRLNFNKKDIL